MKLVGIKICPFCGNHMELIEDEHTELDYFPSSEYYWECYDCGCCIDGNMPDEYEGIDPDIEYDDGGCLYESNAHY